MAFPCNKTETNNRMLMNTCIPYLVNARSTKPHELIKKQESGQ